MILQRQSHYVQLLFLCVSDKRPANGSHPPHILCTVMAALLRCYRSTDCFQRAGDLSDEGTVVGTVLDLQIFLLLNV